MDATDSSRWRPRVTGVGARFTAVLGQHTGWLVALLLVLVSVLFVQLTQMQPEYDAYGWLVWGREALHWDLNTNGAPSWKPLTFLFTFPYALAGNAQPWLWMVTSVAGALAGPIFAARIAYRLTGSDHGRYPQLVAAAFAGVGVLGIAGYWPLILIASSDPMIVTLCLAAIDSHLSNRPRLAFVLLVLAALGRPEVWIFLGLYAVWAWRSVPAMRVLVAAGILAIPALWFGISALTAKSWLRAGDVALNTVDTLRQSPVAGVLHRFRGLYELPMQLAAAAGVAFAIVRRDRAVLMLVAAAAAWVVVEVAFAFHGWPAVARYMAEPAAVLVVVAAVFVGRLLAAVADSTVALRWAAVAAVLILIGALVPVARQRVGVAGDAIAQRRQADLEIDRLAGVIARDGGAARILGCGTPVSVMGYQSTLAWDLGLNVGFVGHKPSHAIHRHYPIVLFKPDQLGWKVLPIHIPQGQRSACDRLRTTTALGPGPGAVPNASVAVRAGTA